MKAITIKTKQLSQPAALIFIYLLGLSFMVFFVNQGGQSTLIDEAMLLIILPIALIGLFQSFYCIGLPSKLITIYFVVTILGSIVTLFTKHDVPFTAPVLGLLLDTKFLIFLGGLLYFSRRSNKNNEEMIIDVCKIILLVTLFNSIFFIRDIFFGGTSLAGIALRPSSIFGYVPIGLFSHKLYTAALSSMALAAAVTLYLTSKKTRFLFAIALFVLFLILSSSMKELGVLAGIIFIVAHSLNNQKTKVSGGSKKLLFFGFLIVPVFAFIFGAELDRLVTNRVDVYLLEENARAALHIKSAEIATDYFPLGSGAGTFSSQPSRSIYFSPLYYEYGMTFFYGASEEHSSFLMDAGWPKFIAEAGWIGGGAYFMAYLLSLLGLLLSFLRRPSSVNVFGVLIGTLVFSSALGSAIFTGDIGLMMCALLFFCCYLDQKHTGEMQKKF